MDECDVRRQVARARTKMLTTHPFYALVAMQMDTVVTERLWPPTAATDGFRLLVHPEAVKTWSLVELVAVVAHEVEHGVRGHLWRRGHRDLLWWNLAGDLVINWDLKEAGFTLPKDALLERKYAGLSIEVAYDRIREDPEWQRRVQEVVWCIGAMMEPDPATHKLPVDLVWQGRIAGAAEALRKHGSVPAHVEALIQQALRPPIDLPTILQRFLVADRNYEDYSWTQPNRRYLASGLYLPMLCGESMPAIGVFVDTSGSVGEMELRYFAGVLEDVLTRARPRRTYVVYCDADIPADGVQEYAMGELLQFRPVGRGGTDFRPPFERAEQEQWPLAAAIYLTDLEGPFPAHEPPYPVLWVQTGEKGARAPWGETFDLEVPAV